MLHIPLLGTDILCMYGKEKELICAWFVTDNRVPVCKAVERYLSDIPWLVDGVVCNMIWALGSINAFVTTHRLNNAGMVIAFDNPHVQESIISGKEANSTEFTMQSGGLLSNSFGGEAVWYHATTPAEHLLQYQLLLSRTGLYVLGCTTPTWAFCAITRSCLPDDFQQSLQKENNLGLLRAMFSEKTVQSPLVQSCKALKRIDSQDSLIMFGLYSTGRALYEAV